MNKIAVIFPGLGYICDRSLLYYPARLLRSMGYEIVLASYTGFPAGSKGDKVWMKKCAEIALEQAEAALADVDWKQYDDVVIVGKSR